MVMSTEDHLKNTAKNMAFGIRFWVYLLFFYFIIYYFKVQPRVTTYGKILKYFLILVLFVIMPLVIK